MFKLFNIIISSYYLYKCIKFNIEDETYIPCKYDWSDLEEKVDYILGNFNELKYIVDIFKKYNFNHFLYSS